MISGGLMYGMISGSLQLAYTYLRHYRQRLAFKEAMNPLPPLATIPTSEASEESRGIYKHYPEPFHPTIRDPSEDKGYDPLGELIKWARVKIKSQIVDTPKWASPILNALDLEYRDRLNFKIRVLERQVGKLKEELKVLELNEKEVQGDK
jgi:hypothetical protein